MDMRLIKDHTMQGWWNKSDAACTCIKSRSDCAD